MKDEPSRDSGHNADHEPTPLQRYLAKQQQAASKASAPRAETPQAAKASTPAPRVGDQVLSDVEASRVVAPAPVIVSAAGFGPRFVAYAIDGAIVWVLQGMAAMMLSTVLFFAPMFVIDAVSNFCWVLVSFFYFGWFYSERGATPGKMLLKLKIVETGTGRRLNYWRAFFRETVGKTLSWVVFGVGFLMAAFRSDKQALHDLIFDTRVVREKAGRS